MKKIKISLIINIIIVVLTIIASIIMFTGFKFMEGEPVLETTKIRMLKFFTVDSNIFMGIVALVFAIKEVQLLNKKISNIPNKIYILKLMATVSVGITFITVFGYLGPISMGGLPSMLMNSNLFFHLIIPVFSILNFVIFERTDKIKFKYVLMGAVPTLIYAICYLINVLIHMENGSVSIKYDWYWFVQGGMWQIIIVLPAMLEISYLLSLMLWRINKNKL